MIANLINSEPVTKSNLAIVHKSQKTEFQRFYEGFHSFQNMELDNEGITFFLRSPNLVESAILDASKRIDDMGLNLIVEATGKCSTTFIVRERSVTNA